MDEEYTIMDVVVHKQGIPINTGESVDSFTQKISDAARSHIKGKLNISKGSGGAWMVELYSNSVIMAAYKGEGKTTYYAFKYTRNNDGKFDFGDSTEVERTTVYKPVSMLATNTTKAVWTTAFINNLPDAAFAIILPGGKKDKEGKTVPRSLRMLPHHNANVKSPTDNTTVDLSHLRNALARLPQSNMNSNQKKKAQSHLNSHAKELLNKTNKLCGDKTRKALGEPLQFGDWTETSKSFWQGVV